MLLRCAASFPYLFHPPILYILSLCALWLPFALPLTVRLTPLCFAHFLAPSEHSSQSPAQPPPSDRYMRGAELTPPPQSLRYKFYDLLYIGESENGKLAQERGHVKEVGEMKALGRYLEECGMLGWWTENMKFM